LKKKLKIKKTKINNNEKKMTGLQHEKRNKNMNLQGFAKVNASQGAPNLISLKKM
jgi:hypothetical protein